MIGGTDLIIPTDKGPAALRLAVDAIRAHWPDAVVEDAATGEPIDLATRPPGPLADEVFVYQDEATARSWSDLGADPSLANTMLHLLRSADSLTIVVDDRLSPAMLRLVREIDDRVRPVGHSIERT